MLDAKVPVIVCLFCVRLPSNGRFVCVFMNTSVSVYSRLFDLIGLFVCRHCSQVFQLCWVPHLPQRYQGQLHGGAMDEGQEQVGPHFWPCWPLFPVPDALVFFSVLGLRVTPHGLTD